MHKVFEVNSKARIALVLCVSALAALNAKNLHIAYSFWLDELATVAIFENNLAGLSSYLLGDNFPPLYYLMIFGWGHIFGLSEVSLRVPSFLAVLGAISILGFWVLRYEIGSWIWPATAAAMLGTLPTASFAAQEVRPYGLMLFFATLVITNATAIVKEVKRPSFMFNEVSFSLSCILLSLTHYFGLILVFIVVLAKSLLHDKNLKIKSVILLSICLLWPVVHATKGALLSGVGGNFWIQAEPVVGPFKTLFVTCPFILILVLIIAYLFLGGSRQIAFRGQNFKGIAFLSTVLAGFIGLMIALDFHTPLSIPRYYLVIAPVAVLLVVEIIVLMGENQKAKLTSLVFYSFLVVMIAAQGIKAQQRLHLKSMPRQNWKDLALKVKKHGICRNGCDAVGYTDWGDYYFRGISLANYGNLPSAPLLENALKRPLLGFHRGANYISSLKRVNPDMTCLEPVQSIKGSTFLMVDSSEAPGLIREGLRPCFDDSYPK